VQLTRLNLAYNSIGEEGIKVLADALIANTKLHFLDIRGNKVRGLGLRGSGFKIQDVNSSREWN
jgi:Ran GTPase-activating protein (RanGAP) involved in mRNA processing and transport